MVMGFGARACAREKRRKTPATDVFSSLFFKAKDVDSGKKDSPALYLKLGMLSPNLSPRFPMPSIVLFWTCSSCVWKLDGKFDWKDGRAIFSFFQSSPE